MGRLIATTQATLDGVIDPVGEWVQADGDHSEYSFERQARSGGLVLGRKTYEGLAGYWPSPSGKWADMINPMPKYVGSNTLFGDLEWNATPLDGDLEDSIPKLKSEVDGDLFMHGSGEFAYALAEKGLIDEYEVYVNPLVWGEGNAHVLGDRGTVRSSPKRNLGTSDSSEAVITRICVISAMCVYCRSCQPMLRSHSPTTWAGSTPAASPSRRWWVV